MPDTVPETLFAQIYNRAPNETDRARLIGVKAGLGLSERDELWPIILTLDHYSRTTDFGRRQMLEAAKAIPEQARVAVLGVETQARAKAETAIAQAVEEAVQKIAKQLAESSQAAADKLSAKRKIFARLIGGGLALVFMVLGAGMAWLYIGLQVGMCSEPPKAVKVGGLACFVEPVFR